MAASAGESLEARLRAVFRTANERILQMQRSEGAILRGMGTTLTALVLGGGGLGMCAHMGDSRLYRVRAGELAQLSRDHNVGAELVERGVVAASDLPHHPQRHMLTRALGAESVAVPEVFSVPYLTGDAFLLVTDGLVEAIGEVAMTEAVSGCAVWSEVGQVLIRACERNVASDDATVVAVRVIAATGPAAGEGSPR